MRKRGRLSNIQRVTPFPAFITHWAERHTGRYITHVYESVVPASDGAADRSQVLWWVFSKVVYVVPKRRVDIRWTCFAANGLIVGASSEAYTRMRACAQNARLLGAPIFSLSGGVRKAWFQAGIRRAWEWNPQFSQYPQGLSGNMGERAQRCT